MNLKPVSISFPLSCVLSPQLKKPHRWNLLNNYSVTTKVSPDHLRSSSRFIAFQHIYHCNHLHDSCFFRRQKMWLRYFEIQHPIHPRDFQLKLIPDPGAPSESRWVSVRPYSLCCIHCSAICTWWCQQSKVFNIYIYIISTILSSTININYQLLNNILYIQ